jgi:hypothetical protein
MAKSLEVVSISFRCIHLLPSYATLCFALLLLPYTTYAGNYRYDKPHPLPSTPEHHPAQRVILITIDGMHAFDLSHWIQHHPQSTLAQLASRGIIYTNANVPIGDKAVGMAALITGGSPISTGIISSDGWDRALSPAASGCTLLGSPITIDGTIEQRAQNNDDVLMIDPEKLPLSLKAGCTPVYPHNLLRVNTIFELIHNAGGHTAWAGDSAAVADLAEGPTGKGVDDLYVPAPVAIDKCESTENAMAADTFRLRAVLNEIRGTDHAGKHSSRVPVLFGMSIASVSVAQSTSAGGYQDALGTPSRPLARALEFTDHTLQEIVALLKNKNMYDSTFFFITSRYGQSPVDPLQRRIVDVRLLQETVDSILPGLAAHLSNGTMSMIWLNDPSQMPAVVNAFRTRYNMLGINTIFAGTALRLRYNTPEADPRMPDILLQGKSGILWTPRTAALSGHGGLSDEDVHVAVLISGPGLDGRTDKTEVPTTQIAPAILKSLGMEKFGLQALHQEHTPAIPDIF